MKVEKRRTQTTVSYSIGRTSTVLSKSCAFCWGSVMIHKPLHWNYCTIRRVIVPHARSMMLPCTGFCSICVGVFVCASLCFLVGTALTLFWGQTTWDYESSLGVLFLLCCLYSPFPIVKRRGGEGRDLCMVVVGGAILPVSSACKKRSAPRAIFPWLVIVRDFSRDWSGLSA